jgi:hypothetical protein
VLLALIGLKWLDARDENGTHRRLDDPDDFVRIEIVTALQRNIPVIPILLDGAKIPNLAEIAYFDLMSGRMSPALICLFSSLMTAAGVFRGAAIPAHGLSS